MLFYHVLLRGNCTVELLFVFVFRFFCLFVFSCRSQYELFFLFFVMFCFVFATVHIAAALKTFKKNCLKKRKKRENVLKKKINSYTLFSMCGWVPQFFMFLVYFWFVEVSKQVVCRTSFKRPTSQLGLDHDLFPSVVTRWSHVHDRSVAINVPFL